MARNVKVEFTIVRGAYTAVTPCVLLMVDPVMETVAPLSEIGW